MIIGKTTIFGYFTHFNRIVSALLDILRRNGFYDKGPGWYYLQ